MFSILFRYVGSKDISKLHLIARDREIIPQYVPFMLDSASKCDVSGAMSANVSRVMLLLVGALLQPAQADLPATSRPTAIEQRVLELVNEARSRGQRCGREHFPAAEPLSLARPLRSAADAHARDMARRSYFEHRAMDGSQPKDRVLRAGYRPRLTGENIAFGPESAEEVVAGWLESPGHCANLMDQRFIDMGVDVALGRQRGHFYWVQVLGAPLR